MSVPSRRPSPAPSRSDPITAAGPRKKVLLVIPNLEIGGAQRVVLHLARYLDRRRFVPILAVGRAHGGFLNDVPSDVRIYDLAASRSRRAVLPILRLVWSLRPDVVLSTCMNFAVALARPLFPRGTRVLVREASSVSAFLAEVHVRNPALATFYRFILRPLYSLVDTVICQSDFMLGDLASNLGIHREKLVRIYNPVDTEKVHRLAALERVCYPGTGPNIVSVGSLVPSKGYDILLAAFSLVRQTETAATLTILGEGPSRPALEAQIQSLGLRDSVRLVGCDANPYSYMAQAELFVSSSRYEGFANVIGEALACGTPVVATDCPSGNREVLDNGVNGWLARSEDPESLAETISRALTACRSLDRSAIRAACESRFSVEQIVCLYEECL